MGQVGPWACKSAQKSAQFSAKIGTIVPIDFCMFEAVYIKDKIYEHYIYIGQPAFCVFEAIFDTPTKNLKAQILLEAEIWHIMSLDAKLQVKL